MASACSFDDRAVASDDAVDEAQQLERIWQTIEVRVTVPSGTYRFRVDGRCGLDGQTIYAEGTSRNAEFSIHISKHAESGLVVFFSNRNDEWETLLDPAADTSEIDSKNIFHFTGAVARNRDETNLEPFAMKLDCTEF